MGYNKETKEYTPEPYRMFSGQGEAVERKYHKYTGKSGHVWLVADQENAAENVYVTAFSNAERRGEGFGGNTLELPLVDGGTFKLHGGWHSNSDALFKDTGVDVRATYYSQVVLSLGRKSNGQIHGVLTDVIYVEEQPIMGIYDRYKEVMATYPEANFYIHETHGGGSSGMTDAGLKRLNKGELKV